MAELFHTIVRVLAKSQTENDHECLNAIRLANKMLSDKNMTWYDVIPEDGMGSKPKQEPPRQKPGGKRPNGSGSGGAKEYDASDTNWAELIERILATQHWINAGGREFLESIAEQYNNYGRITVKQAAAVQKFNK